MKMLADVTGMQLCRRRSSAGTSPAFAALKEWQRPYPQGRKSRCTHDAERQDRVHLRRQPRHRSRDRAARGPGRRQRSADREDRRPEPEARGHRLHGGRGDRGGRRPGAADRRGHPRRGPGRGGGGADGGALRRHQRVHQQRLRDQPVRDGGARHEALRPDAGHQHARHVRRQPGLYPASAARRRTRTFSRCRRRSASSRAGSARTLPTRSPSTA